MYWANFLHIYQPPTQKEIWVKRITDESYRKIFRGFLDIPRAKLSLNINGVLCELLEQFGGRDVLNNISLLLKRGALELTGSAKFHAFLPFLPESEIKRQILLNEETLDKYFGKHRARRGFFSPEMAYSYKVAKVAQAMGYKWIIIDELGFPRNKSFRADILYTVRGLGDFHAFFRERNLSFTILSAQVGTVPTVLRYLGPRLKTDQYVVTAMDGETFGHHRPGMETLLFDLMKSQEIEVVRISDLLSLFQGREPVEPQDSTWAITKRDLKYKAPFARWKSKDNIIQKKQWALTRLAMRVTQRSRSGALRRLLDRALHSDQYWWASARPWWSLEMIERGAHELKCIVAKAKAATPEEKHRAGRLYQEILYTGFMWQRTGLVDEISRQEDEEIQERLGEKEKLFISREEYLQMIGTLEHQMRLAAQAEEYHRAAMIKDRIRELREEMEKHKKV